MPGKLPTSLALARLELQEIDARPVVGEGHVGDLLPVRRESRRQHKVLAVRQVTQIGAVLVHDGEPLDTHVLGPRFVDEDDARVEISALAGQSLVDRIGDDVGDAPPVAGEV